jgi:hypothetical protein
MTNLERRIAPLTKGIGHSMGSVTYQDSLSSSIMEPATKHLTSTKKPHQGISE